jgi:FKBP-type peptidyl-prolyl cis-trans isomerase SlyD
MPRVVIVVALLCGVVVRGVPAGAAEPELIVEDGNDISIEYTLSTKEGEVINSNVGGEPFTYRQGVKSMECMGGVQKRLAGHKAGDRLSLLLPPEEACGPVDSKAVIELALALIPEQAQQVGRTITLPGPHGTELHGTIKEIKKNSVVLDVNHRLAGKTVRFDVRILKIVKGAPDRFLILPPPTPHSQ